MASSGPNSGGTFADDNSVGVVAWTTVSNAASSNNTYAGCYLSAGAAGHYLKCTNFGFAIPGGSTIDGVIVIVECYTSQKGIEDNAAYLVKGGSIVGSNKKNALLWDDSVDTNMSHGGVADLWGTTLTVSDVNASDFGFVIQVTNVSSKFSGNAYIDHITITVYYTEGGGPSSAISSIGNVSYSNVSNVSKVNKANISKIINIT